ncbi:MAG: hypothetical protein VX583_01540, partial [Bdellovibrionota bacterium]
FIHNGPHFPGHTISLSRHMPLYKKSVTYVIGKLCNPCVRYTPGRSKTSNKDVREEAAGA